MKTSQASRTIRNPHAAASKQRSKKFADRRERRAKDARKSWRNEEH